MIKKEKDNALSDAELVKKCNSLLAPDYDAYMCSMVGEPKSAIYCSNKNYIIKVSKTKLKVNGERRHVFA